MITRQQYFGKWLNSPDMTSVVEEAAEHLIETVNSLMQIAEQEGVHFPINPVTGSQISGRLYGGFRPKDCTEGSPRSAHKLGMAVDLYDPDGEIDAWCFANQEVLGIHHVHLEHPEATKGWSHWSIKTPLSGRTVFWP